MGDVNHHSRIAKEKREAALEEFEKRRFTVVGDLVLKVVEQTIEAAAALTEKHFHVSPRTAHAQRVKWVKQNFPEVAADIDAVWGTYGDLGYNELDGNRAREAIEAMESILDAIEKRAGIRVR